MSSEKIKNYCQAVLALEIKRAKVLTELLEVKTMLRGAYACVITKCGRTNCRCYDGEGHYHSRITWRENGNSFTKKVPHDEISWTQEMTDRYRQFQALRKDLDALERETSDHLDALADQLVQQTREAKPFLEVSTPIRKKTQHKSPK